MFYFIALYKYKTAPADHLFATHYLSRNSRQRVVSPLVSRLQSASGFSFGVSRASGESSRERTSESGLLRSRNHWPFFMLQPLISSDEFNVSDVKVPGGLRLKSCGIKTGRIKLDGETY